MLQVIDYDITKFIFDLLPHNFLLNELSIAFSLVGVYAVLWLFIFLVWAFTLKRMPKEINIMVIISVFTVILLVITLKDIIERDRPCDSIYFISEIKTSGLAERFSELGYQICLNDYSFPSLHAALAFCFAFIFSKYFKKYKTVLFITALIVCISRIYLGQHFIFDVLFGACIGYFVPFSLFKFVKS